MTLDWVNLVLPFVLLLARIAAMFSVLPIFGSASVPGAVRVGTALLVTIFFAFVVPPGVRGDVHWLRAALLVAQEAVCGLALGLAARFAFLAVQQGGYVMAQQMGFADAETIDPESGEESQAIVTFLEMTFALFFLASGCHQLLLGMIARSYEVFPVGGAPQLGALAGGLVAAASAMMLLALKLAAPVLAAFMVLTVVLAILARVLPEMNILFESFPVRVGLGFFMAAMIVPLLDAFTKDLTLWMSQLFKRLLTG